MNHNVLKKNGCFKAGSQYRTPEQISGKVQTTDHLVANIAMKRLVNHKCCDQCTPSHEIKNTPPKIIVDSKGRFRNNVIQISPNSCIQILKLKRNPSADMNELQSGSSHQLLYPEDIQTSLPKNDENLVSKINAQSNGSENIKSLQYLILKQYTKPETPAPNSTEKIPMVPALSISRPKYVPAAPELIYSKFSRRRRNRVPFIIPRDCGPRYKPYFTAPNIAKVQKQKKASKHSKESGNNNSNWRIRMTENGQPVDIEEHQYNTKLLKASRNNSLYVSRGAEIKTRTMHQIQNERRKHDPQCGAQSSEANLIRNYQNGLGACSVASDTVISSKSIARIDEMYLPFQFKSSFANMNTNSKPVEKVSCDCKLHITKNNDYNINCISKALHKEQCNFANSITSCVENQIALQTDATRNSDSEITEHFITRGGMLHEYLLPDMPKIKLNDKNKTEDIPEQQKREISIVQLLGKMLELENTIMKATKEDNLESEIIAEFKEAWRRVSYICNNMEIDRRISPKKEKRSFYKDEQKHELDLEKLKILTIKMHHLEDSNNVLQKYYL